MVDDAGRDAASEADNASNGAVLAPFPAVLTPCPDGWAESASGNITVCQPAPDAESTCTGDTAHFVDRPGCTLIGTACPEEGWPSDLPDDQALLYVDANTTASPGLGT